jgi:hypothetical protein
MKNNSCDHPTEQILKFLFRRAGFEHDCEPLSPGRYQVELQLVPTVCWQCHQALAAVRGYRFADVFIALADIGDTRLLVPWSRNYASRHPASARFPTTTARPPAGSISRLNAPGAAPSLVRFS